MVKLASARESRMYGPRLRRNRFEYMNAGVYVFATILLATGFAALLSVHPMPGLVLILMGLGLIVLVNLHDLMAHLAGIDYRVGLMEYDMQLGFVELAVPLLQFFGTLLFFLALIFLLIQGEKGYNSYNRTEKHSMNMLIAGTVLWVVGSVLNSCQIYERADGHVQVLQQSVQIPFLMGSLLFAVASVINYHEQIASVDHHGLALLGGTLIWLGIVGSFMLFMGGLTNVIKVFKMQQIDAVRLEKLRGGAQERLVRGREGHVPLILENEIRRKRQADANEEVIMSSTSTTVATAQTPYKDVLVGQA